MIAGRAFVAAPESARAFGFNTVEMTSAVTTNAERRNLCVMSDTPNVYRKDTKVQRRKNWRTNPLGFEWKRR